MKKLLLLLIPILALAIVFARPKMQPPLKLSVMEKDQLNAAPARMPASLAEAEKQVGMVRKIIQSGEITLEIKRYEPFFQALQKRVELMGGFIANIQSQRSGQSVSSASLTLRVPPNQLQTTVSWLREQGVLTNEHIQAEDISEEYYDLQARLENAKRFEARLLEMLKTQTGKLQDLILVEGKLNEIREQIEQMEGRVRYFDALTNLATLTVQVQVESLYVPPAPPTFAHRIAVAWKNSVEGLFETGKSVALLLVSITPWVFPLLLAAFVLRMIVRFVWKTIRVRAMKPATSDAT